MLIAVRSKIAENTNPEYYQLIKKLIRMRKFNYVLISVLLITSQSCSNASDSDKKVTDSGTSIKEMPVSVENAAIQQTASSVKQQLTVKQSLDKAKSEGKAVFVVVSGTGATDTDKATAIAKGATTIYKNAVIVQMNRDDASNAQLVAEWRLAGAPLPLILVVSSKGLPTGGYVLNDATAENIAALVPSPKLETVYEAIGSGKHAIVVFSKKSFTDKAEVIKISKEAVSMLNKEAVFVEVDMDDPKETNFMNQLRINKSAAKASLTLVINKQGQVAGTSTTVPDAAKLVAAANAPVKSGCGPGCGPAGCAK